MARKRAGSIDSDDSTNARAERRAKRTQFLGTRLRGRTDSCYILASALKGESCCECTCCNALAPVILVAIGIQILVPIQAMVYLCKQETVIAPGFRSKEDVLGARSIRRRWLNHFVLDLTSFILLLYLYLSTFSLRDRQRQLKFLWLSPKAKLNKCYLALGTLTMLIVSIFSLLIPYMLFRLDPSTTDMLLNALALDFMVHADEALVRNLEGNHSFNAAIRRARARLGAIPRDTDVVAELAEIESASWCALLGGFCRSSAMRGEVGYRLGRLLYRVVAFCVLALSITGAASAPGIHLALSRRWREGRVASAQVATSPTSTAAPSCTSSASGPTCPRARTSGSSSTRTRRILMKSTGSPPPSTWRSSRRSSSSSSGRRSRSGAPARRGAPRAPRSPTTSRCPAAPSEHIAPSSPTTPRYKELLQRPRVEQRRF